MVGGFIQFWGWKDDLLKKTFKAMTFLHWIVEKLEKSVIIDK